MRTVYSSSVESRTPSPSLLHLSIWSLRCWKKKIRKMEVKIGGREEMRKEMKEEMMMITMLKRSASSVRSQTKVRRSVGSTVGTNTSSMSRSRLNVAPPKTAVPRPTRMPRISTTSTTRPTSSLSSVTEASVSSVTSTRSTMVGTMSTRTKAVGGVTAGPTAPKPVADPKELAQVRLDLILCILVYQVVGLVWLPYCSYL